ncbi:hypothetical protein BO99DRAFT_94626 [Aspergillus violaceofuscus CBS 115571]|uniref:Uncharacterized protein n=1 Tax=Aspergillus violaceofuscus (strain CBS 115571) TaxID=1450538 RepID=A0A2V5HGQ0_ASPV1|nr:hypothetical protein BO99DRAFT_94626 [Aspergillus violaceofuscus CBS 115571]
MITTSVRLAGVIRLKRSWNHQRTGPLSKTTYNPTGQINTTHPPQPSSRSTVDPRPHRHTACSISNPSIDFSQRKLESRLPAPATPSRAPIPQGRMHGDPEKSRTACRSRRFTPWRNIVHRGEDHRTEPCRTRRFTVPVLSRVDKLPQVPEL